MKKRPSIAMLTALLAVVFAAGIGVYSSYIGMKIYQESSDNLFESFSQISKTFTLFVQRNWTVLGQWDGLLKNTGSDADAENIWPDVQGSKESWRYSDFYLLNEDSQYLTADGRKGSAGSISGVIQELYQRGRADRLHLHGELRRAQDRVRHAAEPEHNAGRRDLYRPRGQL